MKRISISYKEIIVAILNSRMGWRDKRDYQNRTQMRVLSELLSTGPNPFHPCDKIVVTIHKFAIREMDDDNFIAGSKWLRDGIAKYLRRDDKQTHLLQWKYVQTVVPHKELSRLVIICEEV